MYAKWDNLDDSDDEADNALEKAQALNERGSKLLTGQGKVPQPEAALECFEQACKQLLRNGKPVSSDARDLAGGVMLNMAVAAHELKCHSLLSRAAVMAPQLVVRSPSLGRRALRTPEEHPSRAGHIGSMVSCRPSILSRQAARASYHKLRPNVSNLHPCASRRHEKVIAHAAAVLDLEPANAYDRGQAHM